MLRFVIPVVILVSLFATAEVALTWLEFRINQNSSLVLSGARLH
jgi:hypothetical protein